MVKKDNDEITNHGNLSLEKRLPFNLGLLAFSSFAGDKDEVKEKEIQQEFGQTCDWIKKRLGEKVASVQISNRLSTSPCVLVSGKFGWSANMER